MKNPYKVESKNTVQIRVHKDMVKVLVKQQKLLQDGSDFKFGKNKFKVPITRASHTLAGVFK